MKRKTFAALAAVCLVLCLILAGCGTVSEEDYPPLEKVDLSSMTLGTVSNSTFSTQYPADKWTGSDGTSPLIIYYNDTQEPDRPSTSTRSSPAPTAASSRKST